jgi:hypothetical protein
LTTTSPTNEDITDSMDKWTTGLILPILIRQSAGGPNALELVKMSSSTSAYTFIQNYEYTNLWEKIRANDALTELLLGITQEYLVRLGGIKSEAGKAVISAFGQSLMYTTNAESFQDQTVRERAVKKEDYDEIEGVIAANMWFVVFTILGWLDLHELVTRLKRYERIVAPASA